MQTDQREQLPPIGPSGREVSDFAIYCEGDTDPTSNKIIKSLIDCDKHYLVYLDQDLYVEWTFNGEPPTGYDDVANRIGRLETLSLTQLSAPSQREAFERLLGEAMARILGDNNGDKAKAILDEAEGYLKARGTENARQWFLSGVRSVAVPSLIIGGGLLLGSNWISNTLLRDVVETLGAVSMGALGAFLSVATRAEDINFEPTAGPVIHRFEGGIRVVVGMTGALFIALAIKADLLLGMFHSSGHSFLIMLVACLIGGASERLVPSLINTMGKAMQTRTS